MPEELGVRSATRAENSEVTDKHSPPPRKHFEAKPIAGAQSTWRNHSHLGGSTASYKPIQYNLAWAIIGTSDQRVAKSPTA